LRGTAVALGSVIVLTGGALLDDVQRGSQAPDELTEIPLMSLVFLAMVWYVRRAVAARELSRRVSEHNLALLQRQRLLVQDASHVLRTPLTIVLGHAELARRTATNPAVGDDLDVVIEELHHLKHISDRLLTLAATEQPDFLRPVIAPVDVLVRQVCSRWSASHPEITLGPLSGTAVSYDAEQLRDAMDELINNALRHTPAGTPVVVSVVDVDGGVAVRVADRGPGIPHHVQDRVFDRFARLGGRRSDGGFGLGLALVRAIAEAHGGNVSVQSKPGRGATLSLWLPAPPVVPAPAPRVDAEPVHVDVGAATPIA
ncbi:MAG TPA: HAMP domain-containing sensor histidine kinase, partial [Micromonosporaceae bacterium]